jgi:hypothetical protein
MVSSLFTTVFTCLFFCVRQHEYNSRGTIIVTNIDDKLSDDVLVGQIFIIQINMSCGYGKLENENCVKVSIPIWPIIEKPVGAPALSPSGRKTFKHSSTPIFDVFLMKKQSILA